MRQKEPMHTRGCRGGGGWGCGSGQGLLGCNVVKWLLNLLWQGVLCSEVTVHIRPSIGVRRMLG